MSVSFIGERNRNTRKNKANTKQKTKKMSNTDPTKTPGENSRVLAKGNQFLLLIGHPPCYSFIHSSLVNVMTVIERKGNMYVKSKNITVI